MTGSGSRRGRDGDAGTLMVDQGASATEPGSQEVKSPISRPEHAMETVISLVLRSGVLASLALLVCGVVLMFVQHPSYVSGPAHGGYRALIVPGLEFPRTVSGIVRSVARGRGSGIVEVGLFVLLMTPITRVLASFVGFMIYRDRRMAVVTGFVLVVLVVSLVTGALA
jgi:uncharacterized membrane protein